MVNVSENCCSFYQLSTIRPSNTSHRLSAISYQLSAISYQLSAISYQLSAISYRLSAIGYQLSAISYQLSAISYQLSAISYQLSTIRPSAIGYQVISHQPSAIGYQLSAISYICGMHARAPRSDPAPLRRSHRSALSPQPPDCPPAPLHPASLRHIERPSQPPVHYRSHQRH